LLINKLSLRLMLSCEVWRSVLMLHQIGSSNTHKPIYDIFAGDECHRFHHHTSAVYGVFQDHQEFVFCSYTQFQSKLTRFSRLKEPFPFLAFSTRIRYFGVRQSLCTAERFIMFSND
jgi:hypothetical protein